MGAISFFPAGKGDSLSEKLVCQKDSELAQEMVANHIRHAVANMDGSGLQLIGIMAHVYADTFSHYGFSGVSSRQNEVEGDSFQLDVKDKKVQAYTTGKFGSFFAKYGPRFLIQNYRNFLSKLGDWRIRTWCGSDLSRSTFSEMEIYL